MALYRLPIEVKLQIASLLSLADRASLACTGDSELYLAAREALYTHAIVVSKACSHPQPPIPTTVACPRPLRRFVWTMRRYPQLITRSLELKITFNAVETAQHYMPWIVTPPYDIRHMQNEDLMKTVRSILPNRPVLDWLLSLQLDHPNLLGACAIILATRLEQLVLIGPTSLASAPPLELVLQDMQLNPTTGAIQPLRPLQNLRSLQFGYCSGRTPVDSNFYAVDLVQLPTIRSLNIGAGVPFASNICPNLTKLTLGSFACRTNISGILNHQMNTVFHGNAHVAIHDALLNLIPNLTCLREFEMVECRICDVLLSGNVYNVHGGGFVILQSMPDVMLATWNTTLESLRIVSLVAPQGQNGGHWLFRHFHHCLGDLSSFQSLRHIDTDAWFLFEGSMPPFMAMGPHPLVTTIGMPASIRTVRVHNLVGEYLRQFYQWLELVIAERSFGGLPDLEEIEFWRLRPAIDGFPLSSAVKTLMQFNAELGAVGVRLVSH